MKVTKSRSEKHRVDFLEVTIEVQADKYRALEGYLKTRGLDFEQYIGRVLENFRRMPPVFGMDTKFTFGKYRLRSYRDVTSMDPGYIDFCIEKIDGFTLDIPAQEYLVAVKAHIEKVRTGK